MAFNFDITAFMSGAAAVTKYVGLVLVLGCFGFLFYWFTSFKHEIIIRQLTGTKKSIVKDKWKIWKDPKTKIEYLRLMKKRDLLPLPPDDSIDLNNRGKFFIEVYRNSQGEYTYITDTGNPAFFQPLTTNQRMILAHQINKANSKGSNTLMQNLPMLVGLGFLIILFFGFITNMEDISKPFIEKKQVELSLVQSIDNIVSTQERINQNLQRIGGKVGAELNISQVPN